MGRRRLRVRREDGFIGGVYFPLHFTEDHVVF